ncbi:MAG: class I SAM-dependent methyltransferase [Chloroflexi bacterium]|nr:class I SAM-dependent methyltransferase [Chloroflexota bacterium]
MDETTTTQLILLNQRFYAAFAESFSSSRSVFDPSLACILPYVPARARLLDAGCGNGRLARILDRERPSSTYLGLDAATGLLEIAQHEAQNLAHISAQFQVADLTEPGWSKGLPGAPFDVAVCLAVLHHIPSFERRAAVVQEMASITKRNGALIVSAWQFMDHPRLRRKVVPWQCAGIAPNSVDPGDYLLNWQRDGYGLRYCHLIDEREMSALAAAAGMEVTSTYRAGGREGDLGLYALLAHPSPPDL